MGRPSQPMITRENAAEVALEIIDEQGLNKLSLQTLAKRLGVKAPSLYYHFKNKAELLEAIAQNILKKSATLRTKNNQDWKETMVAVAVAARRAFLLHPNAAPLLMEFFPRRIMLPAYNRWVSIYDVPEAMKMVVLEGLEKITFGSAMIGSFSRAQGLPAIPEFDPAEYTDLDSAMKANTFNEEQVFIETIRRFLASF